MTIGRFQPFTVGHENMVKEGESPCIVYQIKPAAMPDNISDWKISGRKVNKKAIQNVLEYMNNNCIGELSEFEKEILKRPFTNELVAKELDVVKKNNKVIVDVVYVTTMFEALARFNKFILDNQDKYEPQYLMCGEDRESNYAELIEKYDELEIERGGEKFPSVIKGVLKTNTGKGRTAGVSGTEVRKSIITNDKQKFTTLMPSGVGNMFDEFKKSFDDFKAKLSSVNESYIISESALKKVYDTFVNSNVSGSDDEFVTLTKNPKTFNRLMNYISNVEPDLLERIDVNVENEAIKKNVKKYGNSYKQLYGCYKKIYDES